MTSFFLALPLAAFGTAPSPQAIVAARQERYVEQARVYISQENRKRGGEFPRVDSDDLKTIVEEFDANGMDPVLGLAVAAQESRFQRAAQSHMGARGIFQFMPKTARWRHVNPLDVRSSARGAARFLKDLLKSSRFRAQCNGDVRCALYHYNAGPNRKRGLARANRYVREVLERADKISAALYARR